MDQLGRYRIDSKLAEGGMGSVFLATDVDGRLVVLKVPHRHDTNSLAALGDEARTGMRLKHPSIVETLDFFVDNGRGVLVVAWIEGRTLYELRRAGPLPPAAIAALGEQLASALDAIHNASDEEGRPLNVLHRDISPNNVMVDASGQARLIDLGIARSADRQQKSTQIGMVKGTLRYLAPEILGGGEHTRATDLWALGVTLWESALARYAMPGDEVLTIKAAMDGTLASLLPGEQLDRDVKDSIQALVAPVGRRLQNARAANAVFSRLAKRHAGGKAALAAAVKTASATRAVPSGPPRAAPQAAEETAPDVTELVPRTVVAPALPSKSDVDLVFTMTVPKDLVMPSGLGPTMRLDEDELLGKRGRTPSEEAVLQDAETPLEPMVHVSTTDSADTIMLDRERAPTLHVADDRPTDKSLSLDVIVDVDDDEETEV